MSEAHGEAKKVTLLQKQAIVDFMQENYSFLMGQFSGLNTKIKKNQKWQEFADVLNKLGPPTKDLIKWKKTWADMKCETKKKHQLKRQNLHTSGAGPIDLTFTAMDDKIIGIVGMNSMDGDEDVDEVGFGSTVVGDGAVSGNIDDGILLEAQSKISKPLKSKPVKKTPQKSASSRKRLFDENSWGGELFSFTLFIFRVCTFMFSYLSFVILIL